VCPLARVPLEPGLFPSLVAPHPGLRPLPVSANRPLANWSAGGGQLDDRLVGNVGVVVLVRFFALGQTRTHLLLGRSGAQVAVVVGQRLELGAVLRAAHAQNGSVALGARGTTGHWAQLPGTTPPPANLTV